ncbi:cobalt ECF transporter T component CbiQ [Desulfosoma caldarium]|uniref:cobalt ECF transporter T component CbiQ n=1 Tax=Desulfosoma caldarium TaxID=610254 RepID=UPI000F4649AE|nr:cobalt ECF transporter T component CbiQ [Desulfosoma caldarium]
MNTVVLPWEWLGAGLGGMAAILAAFWFFRHVARVKKASMREHSPASELDTPLPELDADEARRSLFHRWDPRVKILSLTLFAFIAVSVHRWTSVFMGLVIAVVSVLVARTPWRWAAQRLGAISGFVLMLLVIMPLTVPFREGDGRLVIEGVSYVALNLRGLELAARIGAKAVIVALIMEPMLRTSPFSVTMAAVHRLGVPVTLCQMLLLMYRYVFVFRHEMQRMWIGMTVRGFRSRTGRYTLHDLSCFVGMLFVRSMERTQRVYEAMLCRGYRGVFPSTVRFALTPADWAWGSAWAVASLGVLAADRWPG